MKLTTLLFALLFTANYAQCENYTINRIGTFDFVSGSDGYQGTGKQIGSWYFYNDNLKAAESPPTNYGVSQSFFYPVAPRSESSEAVGGWSGPIDFNDPQLKAYIKHMESVPLPR